MEILVDDRDALFDVGGYRDLRQHDGDPHLALLVVECLGEGIGLVSVFLQELFDLLAFLITDARPVMNDFVHSGFGRAGHFGDLL